MGPDIATALGLTLGEPQRFAYADCDVRALAIGRWHFGKQILKAAIRSALALLPGTRFQKIRPTTHVADLGLFADHVLRVFATSQPGMSPNKSISRMQKAGL